MLARAVPLLVKFHLLCALIVPFAVAEGEENIDMAEEENVLKWQR